MRSLIEKYGLTPGAGVIAFDPGTMLMVGSMAVGAVGTAISAGGTIAGGRAANQSAQFTAAQLDANAAGATASSQRTMLDTQERTRLAVSTARARAGASGVDTGVGSPAENEGAIARRGSYLASMDLFRGQNTATGLENQAAGTRYSGNAAEIGADASAMGTIAAGAGSMLSASANRFFPVVPRAA